MPNNGRISRRVTAWAVAGGLAIAGTLTAAHASAGAPAPSPSPKAPAAAPGPGDHPAGHAARGKGSHGAPGLAKRAVHGEFVVAGKDGYRTVAVQRGQVTSVSPTAITLLSADGFSQTYAVTPATKVHKDGKADIGAVQVGDKAVLAAAVDNGSRTAERIHVPTGGPGEHHGAPDAEPADG